MAQEESQVFEGKQPADTSTPQRLMDAAEELIADGGYRVTSVRDITTRAGCNLASVNYHFGSKQKLYIAVFQRMLTVLRDYRIAGLEKVIQEPEVDLETILRTFCRVFLEPLVEGGRGPRMIQLFMREMLEPHIPGEMIIDELFEPIARAFRKALRKQLPDLSEKSARLCMISMVGQLVHMLQSIQMYERAGRGFSLIHGLEEAVQYIVQFAAAGIRECAASDAGEGN